MNLEKKNRAVNNLAVTVSAALLASTLSSGASAIAVGTYNLFNHPDGSASPPPYGMRLDGLLTGNAGDIYTFDFEHASSNMTLVYDGSTIVISGTAFGGQDSGSGYVSGTTDVWTIDFTYTVGVSQSSDGGLDDVRVSGSNFSNFGRLTSSLGSFELADFTQPSGLAFQFGDQGGAGHRGFAGISGWGWMAYGSDCIGETDCSNLPASDWLFTASPIPVPAAAWLFGSALLGLVGIKRNKK